MSPIDSNVNAIKTFKKLLSLILERNNNFPIVVLISSVHNY